MKVFKMRMVQIGLLILFGFFAAGCNVTADMEATRPQTDNSTAIQPNSESIEATQTLSSVASETVVTPIVPTAEPTNNTEVEHTEEFASITPSSQSSDIDIIKTDFESSTYKWKLIASILTDTCQYFIIEPSKDISEIQPTNLQNAPFVCIAYWHPNGNQLAIINGNRIEIIDILTMERIFFENPFQAQLVDGEYSILDVASWSHEGTFLAVRARNLLNSKPVEIYQTVIFNVLTGEELVFNEGFDFKSWSLSSEKEFGFISNENNTYRVGVWNLDQSAPVELMQDLGDAYYLSGSNLLLSPDGKAAILNARNKNTASDVILYVNFQTHETNELQMLPDNTIPWAWSPSGTWVSFYGSNGMLFGKNLDSENLTLVPFNDSDALPISWLPSDDIFLYTLNEAIYSIALNNGGTSSVFIDLTEFSLDISSFSPFDLWVTEND